MPNFDSNQLAAFQNAFKNGPSTPEIDAQKQMMEQQARLLQDAKLQALKQFLIAPKEQPVMQLEAEGTQNMWDSIKNAAGKF